jgi:hypothetical protein
MAKRCSLCEEVKPLTEFHKHKPSKDGHKPRCKVCQNAAERTARFDPHRRAVQTYHDIKKRLRTQREYAQVELRISRDDFVVWYTDQLKTWFQDRPGEKPSVDRKDGRGHYEAGNIRILEVGENSRLRIANKNIHAPAGKAWCRLCQAYLPTNAFHKNAARHHGLQDDCKFCRSSYRNRGNSFAYSG